MLLAPLALKAGIGLAVVGSAVAIPFATGDIVFGGNWSVTSLFSTLGCATITKTQVGGEGENIYLCYFSPQGSDWPKLKLFYHSTKDSPRKIVKIKATLNGGSSKDISLTLDNGTNIVKKADSSFMNSWIQFEGSSGMELIPEEHCSIQAGHGEGGLRNMYNFNCSINREDRSNVWTSKAKPFQLVYVPDSIT